MNNYLNPKDRDLRDKGMIKSLIISNGNNQQQNVESNQLFGLKNIKQNANIYRNQDQPYNQQRLIATSREPVRQPCRQNQLKRSSQGLRIISLQQIDEKLNKIAQEVQKHDQKLANLCQKSIIQKAINQLKKPNIFREVAGSANFTHNMESQIYQHLFNFKLELKAIKQQAQHFIKRKQFQHTFTEKDKTFHNSIQRLNQIMLASMRQSKIENLAISNASTTYENDKNEKISMEINNLWEKINKLAKQLDTKKSIRSQLVELKASTIKSTKPNMIVQYQQIIKVKQKQSIVLLNESVYYVDDEGYLLDYDKHYILKQNEEKVKLEAKHVAILKSLNSFN